MKNVEELTEKAYPDISNISTKTLNWFQEGAILSPSNEQIDEIKILFFQNLTTQALTSLIFVRQGH